MNEQLATEEDKLQRIREFLQEIAEHIKICRKILRGENDDKT